MGKLTIYRSSTTKRPYIWFNHTKWFGFKIGEMPKKFNSIKHERPINSWFNYRGYTFLSQEDFVDMFGNITIE
jgi:hypothetical protein